MSKRKIKKIIWIGQLWINLPILLFIFAAPLMILLLEPLSPFYLTVLLAILVFALSMGLAWVYWSFMITKWRIWAFSRVPESDYPKLKKLAIAARLIWSDQVPQFTKTEIRSREEKTKLIAIEEQIQIQQELGELRTILNTGEQVTYAMSRKQVLISSLGHFTFGVGGIYLCFTQYYPLGILAIIVWVADYQNTLFIFHINKNTARFEINQQGIFSTPFLNRTILWESLYSCHLIKDSQLLLLVLEEKGKKKKLKIRLWPYEIPDYDLLENQLEIFSERFLHRWEQRSFEDN